VPGRSAGEKEVHEVVDRAALAQHMVQEKTRTSHWSRTAGRSTEEHLAGAPLRGARQRQRAGRPISAHRPVVQSPSCSEAQATPNR